MRLVTYEHEGRVGVGIETEDGVRPTGVEDMTALIRDGLVPEPTGPPFQPDRLLIPLRPSKVLCCGINYKSHGAEAATELPQDPYLFAKLPTALSGPGDPIEVPFPEAKVDWEVELAFVIGKRAKRVSADDAMDFVFGYTLLHDVSERLMQIDWTSRTQSTQILLGKNPDGFCPIGPCIVTKDELPDPGNVRIGTSVNGVRKQDANTSDWIFSIPRLIEFVTRLVTLEPGDVISTGTPDGIGYFRDPPEFLQPGDVVTIEAEGIGELTNPVVAGW